MSVNPTETILYAVTGMSPAVLTETVWALAEESPPQIPDRIIVITTTTGRQRLIDELFSPTNQIWQQVIDQIEEKLGIPLAGRLRFAPTHEHIRVPTFHPLDTQQAAYELVDIRNREENTVFADFILENLRGITDNPESLVIGSLAGGRKTMSTFLYAAFTLVGRVHDRLTHVLVNAEAESARQPSFFFPEQDNQQLLSRSGGSFIASEVTIQLADVPFTALRPLIEHHSGSSPSGFSQLVRQYGRRITEAVSPLQLALHPARCAISINTETIELGSRSFVLLWHLAQQTMQGVTPAMSYTEAFDALVDCSLQFKKNAPTGNLGDWRHAAAFPSSFEADDIRKVVSNLRRQLQDEGELGYQLAKLLPKRRFFGLNLPPDQITLNNE